MVTEEVKFGFENLELWKKVREFKNEVSKEARKWPSEEKFKLTDQVIRSSRSINALLSEGHGRLLSPINFIFVSRQEDHCPKLLII